MRHTLTPAFAIILTGLSVASCQQDTSGKQPPPSATPAAPKAYSAMGQHWVQDQQLRTVMAELSLKTRESWPRDLPGDPEVSGQPREETFRQAASLADALASAAGRIPASVDKLLLSDADRQGFSAEASRLRDNALRLKEAAGQRRLEPMQRALDQVNSSCIACHSKYRDFTGELNAQKASLD